MSNDVRTITIFEVVEAGVSAAHAPGSRPVHARGAEQRVLAAVETGVDTLRANMANFISGVSDILAAGANAADGYEMDSVEVQCQISGSGKVGFVGTGVEVEGGSSLTIVFKKKAL